MDDSREGVVMILVDNGKVLAERRTGKGLLSGAIVFPAGTVEESDRKNPENYLHITLKREAREEFGITLLNFSFIKTIKTIRQYKNKIINLTLNYFIVKKWKGSIPEKGENNSELFWLDLSSLDKLDFENDREMAAQAISQPNMLR